MYVVCVVCAGWYVYLYVVCEPEYIIYVMGMCACVCVKREECVLCQLENQPRAHNNAQNDQ